VRVHSFTLSFTPKLPETLQALALVVSPRLGLRQNAFGMKLIFSCTHLKYNSQTWRIYFATWTTLQQWQAT
jgi:hypothetical protein